MNPISVIQTRIGSPHVVWERDHDQRYVVKQELITLQDFALAVFAIAPLVMKLAIIINDPPDAPEGHVKIVTHGHAVSYEAIDRLCDHIFTGITISSVKADLSMTMVSI